MKKVILTVSIVIGILSGLKSQDIRLTQAFNSPIHLNPALIGASDDMSFNLNYRNQWSGLDGGFSTARFTFFTPVLYTDNTSKLSAGLSFMNDQAGAFNNVNVNLAAAYSLKISDSGHWVSASIYGGFVQNSIDVNDLTFDEQYVGGSFDASNGHNEYALNNSATYGDVGFGMLWFYNPEDSKINAFAGFSGHHVNTPNQTLIEDAGNLPARFTSIAGIKFITDGKLDFTPNVRAVSQSGAEEFAYGLYMDYRVNDETKLTLGSWYRQRNSFAFLFGVQYTKFRLGYSYDLPSFRMNQHMTAGITTHEISLSFNINQAEKQDVEMGPNPLPFY